MVSEEIDSEQTVKKVFTTGAWVVQKFKQTGVKKKKNSLTFYFIGNSLLLLSLAEKTALLYMVISSHVFLLFLFSYALEWPVVQVQYGVSVLPNSWLFHAAKDQTSSIPALLDLNHCTVGVFGARAHDAGVWEMATPLWQNYTRSEAENICYDYDDICKCVFSDVIACQGILFF